MIQCGPILNTIGYYKDVCNLYPEKILTEMTWQPHNQNVSCCVSAGGGSKSFMVAGLNTLTGIWQKL